jgi:hypothetical protein
VTSLETTARQLETAAHSFGSGGPELEVFNAMAAFARALGEQSQAIAATQQALGARVEALTAPTQEMRRGWGYMMRGALSDAARGFLRDWRWALFPIGVALMVAGAGVGAGGMWYAMHGAGVCATAPEPVKGGWACWVSR